MTNKIILALSSTLLFSSCYKEMVITTERPDGWGYYTHSDQVEPDYSKVFPDDKVKKMYIEIAADDWTTMQDNLEELYGGSTGGGPGGGGPGGGGPGGGGQFAEEKPTMVKCQVYVDDIQWFDVGIRYKGNSSLQSAYQMGKGKLPLRMDFDYFEDENPLIDDQRFYGFKELSLGSNFNDNSLMHEKVATDIFRDFGVPASRTAFYEIYIDNGDGNGFVYYGLYTMIEVVFDTMLDSQFGSESGNCYKPDGNGASFSSNYGFVYSDFEKKNNESSDWSDVENLYNVLQASTRTSNPTEWRSDLEAVFDVDAYLKYLAANTVMQNWDTYGLMTHNYYLYNDPVSDQLNWIPWDNNEALNDDKNNALDFDFGTLNSTDWPMIGYIYADSEYKSIYDDYIDEFITTSFTESKVHDMYDTYYNLIYSSVENESGIYTYLTSFSDFTNSLSTQKTHCTNRITAAAAYTP